MRFGVKGYEVAEGRRKEGREWTSEKNRGETNKNMQIIIIVRLF